MPKKPKLTKKMLSHLDKAEVRTICLVAMNVPPEQAYQVDTKWCIDHIYENQMVFAEADLSDVPVKKWRNPHAYMYIRRLQGYLLGKEEAPTWPPHTEGVDDTNPQTEIMPEAQPVKPVKVTKVVELKTSQEDEVLEAETAETTDEVQSTIEFKKVSGFGNNKVEEEPVVDNDLGILIETVDMISTAVQEFRGDTASDIDKLNTRVESVENALLFIINSAILGDGQVITSLEEVPSPPYN